MKQQSTYLINDLIVVYSSYVVGPRRESNVFLILENETSEFDCYLKHPDLLKGENYLLKASWSHISIVNNLKSVFGYYCLNLKTLEKEFIWNLKVKGKLV